MGIPAVVMFSATAHGLLLLLLALGLSPSAAWQSDEPPALFEAHKEELLTRGVRTYGSYVFGTVKLALPRNASPALTLGKVREAELLALQRMLDERLARCMNLSGLPDALRHGVGAQALLCIEGNTPLEGLRTLYSEHDDESVTAVCCLPQSTLELVRFDLSDLRQCLDARIRSGSASPVTIFVSFELDGVADTPNDASPSIDPERLLGPLKSGLGSGLELQRRGRWVDPDGRLCESCMLGWAVPAATSVLQSGVVGTALQPMPPADLTTKSADELLDLYAHRIHDPSVRAALVDGLKEMGFSRSARAFECPQVTIRPFADRPGSQLDRTVRARLFSLPLVALLLLTDGECGIAWGPVQDPYSDAVTAFNESTQDGLARAILLLCESLESSPSIDALSLLSAALVISGDPHVAEPLGRAAWRAMPSHRFAGLNTLRAQQALDMKDAARALFPQVTKELAQHPPSDWTREQLRALSLWLGVSEPNTPSAAPANSESAPPSASTPASAPASAPEGA